MWCVCVYIYIPMWLTCVCVMYKYNHVYMYAYVYMYMYNHTHTADCIYCTMCNEEALRLAVGGARCLQLRRALDSGEFPNRHHIDFYWCILMYIDVHRRLYQIPVFRLGWPWFAHSHDRSLCFRNLVLWIPNAELFDPPKQVGETLGRRELQIGSSDPQRNGWCWISVPLKLPGVNRRWACVPSQTDVQQ